LMFPDIKKNDCNHRSLVEQLALLKIRIISLILDTEVEFCLSQKMASTKIDKPSAGSQAQPPVGQVKKEPAKAPATKPAPKKTEQKPREPRKKVSGGKPAAAKN
ncbi:hypothetical protein ACH5RR_030280, partial [Cinchona calisaya]